MKHLFSTLLVTAVIVLTAHWLLTNPLHAQTASIDGNQYAFSYSGSVNSEAKTGYGLYFNQNNPAPAEYEFLDASGNEVFAIGAATGHTTIAGNLGVNGNITLGLNKALRVRGNAYAFQYLQNPNYGLYFNATDTRYEFRTGTAAPVGWIHADNGNAWLDGDLWVTGNDIYGDSTGSLYLRSFSGLGIDLEEDLGSSGYFRIRNKDDNIIFRVDHDADLWGGGDATFKGDLTLTGNGRSISSGSVFDISGESGIDVIIDSDSTGTGSEFAVKADGGASSDRVFYVNESGNGRFWGNLTLDGLSGSGTGLVESNNAGQLQLLPYGGSPNEVLTGDGNWANISTLSDGDWMVSGNDLYAAVSGNVGIGTISPGYDLEVNGTAAKPGGGSWTATSDRRLKQNVTPYTDGLTQLRQIEPVTYQYNEQSGYATEPTYVGVVAQDLREVAPYMVGEYDKDGQTYLNVDNSAMTYLLINAVKELAAENEAVKAQNEMLQNRLDRHNREVQAALAEKDRQFQMLMAEMQALKQCTDCEEAGSSKTVGSSQPAIDKSANPASLHQNVPNPFTSTTLLPYYLPEGQRGTLTFFGMNGTELSRHALEGNGYDHLTFDSRELPTGIYFYRLEVDGKVIGTKRMMSVE